MIDQLLAAAAQPRLLLQFTIQGIHTELLGAGNQPWDSKVAQTVHEALQQPRSPSLEVQWYALHLRWFAKPPAGKSRKDLDNFRVKPILDRLTVEGFWPEDNINYIRAIYSEVVLVDSLDQQRVVVSIYGIEG